MADVGWTSEAAYTTFLETRAGFINKSWTAPQKKAALQTAYDRLRFSSLLSIPSSPSVSQLEILAYAQSEYAINFNMLGGDWADGEKKRLSIISHGTTMAGIVKEEYNKTESDANKAKIPNEIIDILDDFRAKKGVAKGELFRDETNNPTYDANMPSELS